MMAADTAPAAVPGPPEPPGGHATTDTPQRSLLAAALAAVEPARPTAFHLDPQTATTVQHPAADAMDGVLDQSTPGKSSDTFRGTADGSSKGTDASGTGRKRSVWKEWALAAATRWAKGGGTANKRLDLAKARAQSRAHQVKENRTSSVMNSGGLLSRGNGGSGAGPKPAKATGGKDSSGAGRKGPVNSHGSKSSGSGSGPAGGGGRGGSGGGRGTGSDRSGVGGRTKQERQDRQDRQPKSPSPKDSKGSKGSGAFGGTGAHGGAGVRGGAAVGPAAGRGKDGVAKTGGAGKQGSSGKPGAPGKDGKGSAAGTGKTEPTGKDSSKDSKGAKSDKGSKDAGAGKDPVSLTKTGNRHPDKPGKNKQPTARRTDHSRDPRSPLHKSRETGHKDGSTVRNVVDHVLAYTDGARDGYHDQKTQNAKEHARLDQAHQDYKNTTQPPAGQQEPQQRQKEADDMKAVKPLTVTDIDANSLTILTGGAERTITRGELRNFKQYERKLEEKHTLLLHVADATKSLQQQAEDEAKNCRDDVEAAKSVVDGTKLIGTLNRLAEAAKVQADEAAELSRRALRSAEMCKTVLTNIGTRYAPLYKAVQDSDETKPAEMRFYNDRGTAYTPAA